jgi:hypothetical protein
MSTVTFASRRIAMPHGTPNLYCWANQVIIVGYKNISTGYVSSERCVFQALSVIRAPRNPVMH